MFPMFHKNVIIWVLLMWQFFMLCSLCIQLAYWILKAWTKRGKPGKPNFIALNIDFLSSLRPSIPFPFTRLALALPPNLVDTVNLVLAPFVFWKMLTCLSFLSRVAFLDYLDPSLPPSITVYTDTPRQSPLTPSFLMCTLSLHSF